VENGAVSVEPSEETGWAARAARWRERAEHASTRYQRLSDTNPVFGLPLAFLARYTARQGVLLASAAAFRMFMWTVPLALLVAGVLAGVSKVHEQDVTSAVKTAGITGAASQEVANTLSEGQQSWWVATLIGAVLFLWATRTLTRNLILVNAFIWSAPSKTRQKDLLIISLIFAGSWIGMFATAAVVIRLGIVPGGPGEKGGLREGDVIMSLDAQEVSSRRELYVSLWRHEPGEQITLEVMRDNAVRRLELTGGDRAEFFK
jgi:hypothetical protein